MGCRDPQGLAVHQQRPLKNDTNFDAPDAHFDYLSLFSGTRAEKVGNPKKKKL
jgi:hypothetical protein